MFRARRDDPQFDFTGPALEYAKALEVELNALMFRQLRRVVGSQAQEDRTIRVSGKRIDPKNPVPHQSLGSLRHLLEKDSTVRKGLRTALGKEGKWLVDEFPFLLKPVVRMRNPAAHGAALRGSEVIERRSHILGIGCEGTLARLARAKSDERGMVRS